MYWEIILITRSLFDSTDLEDDLILANSSWIKEESSFNKETTFKEAILHDKI